MTTVEYCEDIYCAECLVPTVINRLEHVTVFNCSLCHKCVAVMVRSIPTGCMFCGADAEPDEDCPWGCTLRLKGGA